jgi:hypothetical protein
MSALKTLSSGVNDMRWNSMIICLDDCGIGFNQWEMNTLYNFMIVSAKSICKEFPPFPLYVNVPNAWFAYGNHGQGKTTAVAAFAASYLVVRGDAEFLIFTNSQRNCYGMQNAIATRLTYLCRKEAEFKIDRSQSNKLKLLLYGKLRTCNIYPWKEEYVGAGFCAQLILFDDAHAMSSQGAERITEFNVPLLFAAAPVEKDTYLKLFEKKLLGI